MDVMSVSDDKKFEVRVEVWEARNSLWVYCPSLWDVERDHCIFSFKNRDWSAVTSAWEKATVRLCLRKFPGNHTPDGLRVEIDCLTLYARLVAPATEFVLADLESGLDRALASDR